MIPVRLILTNYGPFRGEHVVELKPMIYSVVARDEEDLERSNWIGKTWFMSAFRYALFGKHTGRLKDDMITDGEEEGSVRLDTDGPFSIIRSKKRGSSEQLVVVREVGDAGAKQDRAQELIEELIGFDREDFDASCWVRQKGSNDIVVADPAVRTDMVSGWMNLGPLQRAYEIESKRLQQILDREDEIVRRTEQLNGMIESVGDPKQMVENAKRLKKSIAETERKLQAVEKQFELSNKIERLRLLKEQLDELVERGKALKADMLERAKEGNFSDAETRDSENQLRTAEIKCREARVELDKIKRLVTGEGFDGICPVMKRDCPVAEQVNETTRKMHAECEKAAKRVVTEDSYRQEVVAVRDKMRRYSEVKTANFGRLEAMRAQAKQLIDEIDVLQKDVSEADVDPAETRREYSTLQTQIAAERGELAAAGKYIASLKEWRRELETLAEERKSIAPKMVVCREAAHVLGRTGAQKEIASAYLGEIEDGANECLGGAGIDLAVKASWGRPGTELASHCSSCGHPFPRGKRAKACEKCGEKRGPHIVEKLELEISSRSNGAAEDVAGLAMQLSAAAWLRARRQAAWSAMFIDEPFAGADARVGELLAGQLVRMLGGRYSFRQAIITSHNAALTEMMPGRILITRLKNGDRRIEVL